MDISEGSLNDPGVKISIWYFSEENIYEVEELSVSTTEPKQKGGD